MNLRQHLRGNAVAYVALFVALGGTSAWAAGQITGKDIKNNTVKSKDVKDGTLLSGDFKAGQLPEGPRGPQGLQGIQGVEGKRGPSAFDPIPSGTTVGGYVGGSFNDPSPLRVRYDFVQLPGVAPVPLDDAHVILGDSDNGTGDNLCPGSIHDPSASPGYLCLYSGRQFGMDLLDPGVPSNVGSSALETFARHRTWRVRWNPTANGHEYDAAWVYTAP